MSDEVKYEPHTWSLGFSFSSELTEAQRLMNEIMGEMVEWTRLRREVEMGLGLNNKDAKRLLDAVDRAKVALAEKPAPPILNSVRRWLAAKIAPARDDDEYDY